MSPAQLAYFSYIRLGVWNIEPPQLTKAPKLLLSLAYTSASGIAFNGLFWWEMPTPAWNLSVSSLLPKLRVLDASTGPLVLSLGSLMVQQNPDFFRPSFLGGNLRFTPEDCPSPPYDLLLRLHFAFFICRYESQLSVEQPSVDGLLKTDRPN